MCPLPPTTAYQGKFEPPVPTEFSTGLYKDNCKKIGLVAKGNRIVSQQKQMDSIEDEFMNIAFKSNKAEGQRESRKQKRK